jgi:hypothetical protein
MAVPIGDSPTAVAAAEAVSLVAPEISELSLGIALAIAAVSPWKRQQKKRKKKVRPTFRKNLK